MTRRTLSLLALLLAALCAPLASNAGAVTIPINSYVPTELGSLDNGSAAAHGINDALQVVGVSSNHAFRWQSGVMTDLGALSGGESIALGINNTGQVVGRSTVEGGRPHAFLWEPGPGMRDLGTLGGTDSAATGINDAGQIVGWAHARKGRIRACLWQGGRIYNLGMLPGGIGSIAQSINASGQVTGIAWDANVQQGFVWTPTVPNGTTGAMVALPPLQSYPAGINAAGNVVGQVGAVPYLWDGAGAHPLPLLSVRPEWWENTGVYGGTCAAINNSNQVVGSALHWAGGGEEQPVFFSSAVTWDPTHGTRQLTALTDQSVWFEAATSVNSDGAIAANDYGKAYLLTPSPLPSRPTYLAASSGDAQALLSWTANSGADTYTVKRAEESGGYVTIASGVQASNYTDFTVQNGTTYTYVVFAVNSWGTSPDSNPAVAHPISKPPAPTGLTAVAGEWQINLSWTGSAAANYYRLYRSTASGGGYDLIGDLYDTTIVDIGDGTGLPANVTLYYVVTAVNAIGESPVSNEAAATPTAPPLPPAPSGLAVTVGDRLLTLNWTANPFLPWPAGTEYYVLKRSTVSGGPYTQIGAFSDSEAFVTGLTNGQTYYFVVTAHSPAGGSSSSNEVGAAPTGPPPPTPPTALTAKAGDKRIKLKWTQSASADVTQNHVYRSSPTSGGFILWATLAATTSYSDNSTREGVKYTYMVTSVSGTAKESPPSNQASARRR